MLNNSIYAKHMWKRKINLWLILIENFAWRIITAANQQQNDEWDENFVHGYYRASASNKIIRVLDVYKYIKNKLSIEHCNEWALLLISWKFISYDRSGWLFSTQIFEVHFKIEEKSMTIRHFVLYVDFNTILLMFTAY